MKIKIKTITLILILLTTTLTTALAESPGQVLTKVQDSYAVTPLQWIINWVEGLWINNQYYKALAANAQNLSKVGAITGVISTNAVLVNQLNLAKDFANNVKTTAIVHAKATFIKVWEETHNATLAKQAALQAADDIFDNATKNVIMSQNVTAENFNTSMHILANAGIDKLKIKGTATYIKGGEIVFVTAGIIVPSSTKLSSASLDNFTFKVITADLKGVNYNRGYTTSKPTCIVHYIKVNESGKWIEVYNRDNVTSTIKTLLQAKQQVHNNLVKYFNNICLTDISNLLTNVSGFLDPYVLAQEFSTNYNTTGYYGYAAAMLALSGLPTTGINKTVSVTVGNKTLSGFMFTDWNTVFARNHTYQVPNGKLVWILTPNGLYKIPEGANFTVSDLRDWQGNRLNSTRMQMYVDPSLNAANFTKSIEELIQHENQLIKAIDNQTTTASGSGGNKWANAINNFWDGLDWQVKAIIVFAAILVVLALIGRSFGKGGVRVG